MTHLLALLGVLSISFSAIFVRLASVSPVTATLYRAGYAVPILGVIVVFTRHADRRSPRSRLLAFGSGIILSLDLALWHESIALIGAGLATVIANVQVVVVAIFAWTLYGERPSARAMLLIAVVLAGIALTSGFARPDAYGSNPVLGAVLGALAGVCYAGFLITFRVANQALGPTSGPLLDSTMGTLAGALLCAPLDPHFQFHVSVHAHVWLAVLAVVSQVIGWLLIATALPRLPALETSVLLLVQPVFAVMWGMLIFAERLSALQWAGTGMVLAGVASISRQNLKVRT